MNHCRLEHVINIFTKFDFELTESVDSSETVLSKEFKGMTKSGLGSHMTSLSASSGADQCFEAAGAAFGLSCTASTEAVPRSYHELTRPLTL